MLQCINICILSYWCTYLTGHVNFVNMQYRLIPIYKYLTLLVTPLGGLGVHRQKPRRRIFALHFVLFVFPWQFLRRECIRCTEEEVVKLRTSDESSSILTSNQVRYRETASCTSVDPYNLSFIAFAPGPLRI